MKKSVKKNYFLNLIYQIFMLIVPIVVTPYISRVLTEVGSGQYSFTSSITQYFTLFAALGFGYYGQRLIAGDSSQKLEQSIHFYEILIARLIPVFASTLVFITLAFFNVYGSDYSYLMMIMTINIVAVAFDITFFFQGNEEFGKIVLRNVIIKIISIACIFILVKNQDDLWKYVLIQSLTLLFSNISLWFYLPKYLVKVNICDIKPLKHLKPTFLLFIPTIAVSVYTTLDKTLIGCMVKGTVEIIQSDGTLLVKNLSDIENGNYEYAEKLVKMAMTIVTSLGTVMIPRNSYRFAQNDIDGVVSNIEKSCRFVLILGIPMVLGIICVSHNLMPWYLGSGYDKSALLMQLLSPLIIIIGLSNVFGLQLLIPAKEDNKFTISVTIGACINLIFNLILIPFFASFGAALSTIIGELIVTSLCIFYSRKYIKFYSIIKKSWKYLVSGLIMFIICYSVSLFLVSSILNTMIIIGIGIFTYFIILFLLKDDFLSLGLNLLKKKLLKKKDHDL